MSAPDLSALLTAESSFRARPYTSAGTGSWTELNGEGSGLRIGALANPKTARRVPGGSVTQRSQVFRDLRTGALPFSIDCDDDTAGLFWFANQTWLDIEFFPEGNTSGKAKLAMNGPITVTVAAGADVLTFSVSMLIQGRLTESTVA